MSIWAIIPAAGIGRRMRAKVPKQYLNLNGRPIIETSLARIGSLSYVRQVVVMLNPEDTVWPTLGLEKNPKIVCQYGGENRYQTVLYGLRFLRAQAADDDWVLVHDAARPCVRRKDVDNLFAELGDHPVGGLLGALVDNTMKLVDENHEVIATVDRVNVWSAFTPQVFRFRLLLDALEAVDKSQKTVTDEATAVELLGYRPLMVNGNRDNIKITHPNDLNLAAQILSSQALE
ncbi:MAG: 2-C-methyl-D-erythritol 4-phosphate cytidylyltransferase [Gammaproteobacteria bacterium]|nr:2-C-methyl-D-erythritol 4-phosphate cytidylyltransferase [Pseudomonadales bacterium]MCP5346402.1 2-C-methyl-D-erythritol 4-phosphate cytidylyltransferase [Pseudomonadales bacterium]